MGTLGTGGAGGVFCIYCGFVKGCFHVSLFDCYAFEAELYAFISAVNRAHHFGWDRIWIECDSLYVVNLLRSRS